MAKFKVTAAEMVYYECEIEAENEQEAMDKAWADDNGDIVWATAGSSDYQIETAIKWED